MDVHSEPQPRRFLRAFFLFILFVIASLALGLTGGVSGFVLLSNSHNVAIKAVRTFLHINGTSVEVPVHEDLTLQESSALIDTAQIVQPSVVAILPASVATSYFSSTAPAPVAIGSGFIITNDGLIITNRHLVSDPTATYEVILNNNQTYTATVEATDSIYDIAILKINASNLPTLAFGSSDSLQVGQFVMTVGNSLGQSSGAVSEGIVSSTNRTLNTSGGRLTDLLQTDAVIGTDTSGGPLVNIAGQVVGVTSNDGTNPSYIIPINKITDVINSIRTTGQILRPYLGVRYVPVTPELQQLDKLTNNYGALVEAGTNPGEDAVIAGSPAATAGIVAGDVILDINGQQVTSNVDLPDLLLKYQVGTTVSIDLIHAGKAETLKITLAQQGAQPGV